ncbi:LuxR C-terminal-related transcriptional regulator [Dictyobacter formicarum]|uniref:LuxR family transcriptional regulator n=1 Tax=Dictyobacter formicarum TaxID=2778368 RepID=A0ABQ3VMR9_9CHLR|nr:LuxR C-terminal-related transcriptional regulator [Dictyobacter formicarum]GHO86976.1 LuxR family transcriptional regulator [Dictyobacter formicarum]
MPEPDLLVTKFTLPPVRSVLLHRSHLLSVLDQSCSVPLTLLLASAGFGKTTLLSAWASQSASQIAWLSLDDQDNDPTRFWTYVIGALRKAGAPVGEATLAMLHSLQPPQLTSALTALINDLAALAQDTVLILDDYHLLRELAIHESLQFFLHHLPPCLHLSLSSRVDPQLPLARLRARGQVVEIREPDLRLSSEEVAKFLTQVMGLSLSAEDIQRLETRTEGWLAGLQLAALSLQRHKSGAVFLNAFSGSHHFILDYVQEEILDALPEAQQRFLLQTSVLESMNADLCQALTGEQASQQMLEALERAHLFLVSLDEERCWYRFHSLFREVLLARLQATQPEQVFRLHRKAALWYQHQEWPHEAISHASASQDALFMAELLESYTERLFLQGELQTLLGWIKLLPQEVLRVYPRLITSYILAFNLLFPFPYQQKEEREHVYQLLQEVERLVQSEDQSTLPQTERNLLHHRIKLLKIWDMGIRALSDGDVEQLNSLAALMQHLSFEDDAVWRQHSFGSLAMASRLAGNFPPMVAALQESRKNTWKEQHRSQEVHILWALVVALIALGQLSQAYASSETLRQLIKRLEVPIPLAAYPDLFHAQLAYEWNQLEMAKNAALVAIEKTAPLHYMDILISAYEVLVRVCIAQGDLNGAEQGMREMQDVSKSTGTLLFRSLVESLWVRLWLAQGNLSQAIDWAEHIPYREQLLLYSHENASLALARVYLAERRYSQALQLLTTLHNAASHVARIGSMISILALQVAVFQASGALQEARDVLFHLLPLAEPEGYIRVFLEAGDPMGQALQAWLSAATLSREGISPALVSYVQMLLAAFACNLQHEARGKANPLALISPLSQMISPLAEPLTPREQEVLHLLAQGASNHDIANQLVVSLRTVKKHVGNLLLKLEAQNRTHAVARARELSLL